MNADHRRALACIPQFDGHFWIERDGKIIDWDFMAYNKTKEFFNLTDEKAYLPANEKTQEIVIEAFRKKVYKEYNNDYDSYLEDITSFIEDFGETSGNCYTNCINDWNINGGKLVFGSFGWKRKNGNGIHYEFGGEKYKTYGDFMRKTNLHIEAAYEAIRNK